MPTYIRLTDCKSSDEKEQEFFNAKNRYEAKQEDFEKIPGSPIAYWVKKKSIEIFDKSEKINKTFLPCTGLQTGDNTLYMRKWFEISIDKSNIVVGNKWIKLNNGGEFRKWYGNFIDVLLWENDGNVIKNNKSSVIRNEINYFKTGITWNRIATDGLNMRYLPNNFIFDQAGDSLFFKDSNLEFQNYLLSFFNSKIAYSIMKIIAPTLNLTAGGISDFPIIFPSINEIKEQIDKLVQQNIHISKEEWDSRETSWDFTASPLVNNEKLKVKNKGNLEDVYSAYCNYWKEQHNTLHQNEEELNRLFIDIYELQDELTPDVELKDITILKNEAKIVEGELVFQADEIMKQFISYAVGVMFGRYSLESEGLLIANMGQEVPTDTTFEIDDDNVIPVLEDNYFPDDIASRFVSFVKSTFGEEHLGENIQFIENALGMTLRKYFVKGFYEDHIKRYKKRPIYWMVASPKKGFMCLMYMHRYTSDIFATIQNAYVREYITKLEAKKEDEQRNADDASNSPQQRNRASKEVEKINKTLEEVIKFDRETLTAFAQNRVEIDLDDGVKVNYCKFKDVLFEYDKKLCK